jgi:phosphoribosylformylglycinamidine synthase subunit PurQ / glutaminase
MKKPKIAVLYFPGSNCEEETKERCIDVGMDAKIVRWNSTKNLSEFDGYIIPGGFSYEDRIRAGVIASKDKIINKIREEIENGKPLLGICNGAQILVETGLIPGLKDKVQMGLASNINPFLTGYYNSWVNIRSSSIKNLFNGLYKKNEVIRLPVAHGEGRFVTKDSLLIEQLYRNDQIAFQYCDSRGKVVDNFPYNPNGAVNNIAAISNKEGNVMAIMPHPERASFSWMINDSPKKNTKMNALKIFESMNNYIIEKQR